MPIRQALAATTVAAALLVPATAAQAAKSPVYAGLPAAQGKQMPEGSDANAFYPRAVTVKKSSKVAFKFRGFHNVVFPAKGEAAAPLAAADPARSVSGATDAAGAPMWFNGLPGIFADPASVLPQGNKVINGKKLHGSGIFQGEGAPPDYVVSFPKRGRYPFVCTIHPGMQGTVKVVGKRGKVPSKAKLRRAATRQAKATVAKAKQLAGAAPAGNVVQAGSDAGEVAFLAFFPKARTVPAGTPVEFKFSADSTELHNVVFGPQAYLEGLAEKFFSPGPQGIALDPLSVYPSEPFGSPISLTPTSHGNGFANTGVLDADAASPFPATSTVTFPAAGTYPYICTVHGPFMSGTITVT